MNSSVLQCCDYISTPIPEASTKWRIPDSEILRELEALSGDHAVEQQMDRPVQSGDSVRCVCKDSSDNAWLRRVILLYPGRKMPGAEIAEEAVLGHSVGDEFQTEIRSKNVALEITDVISRQPLPVGDALVRALELPDVETVADYMGWYRAQHEGQRRQKACFAIVHEWLTHIAVESRIYVDEAEKKHWTTTRAQIMLPAMLEAGIDMRKPRDGGEMLTDAQAIEMLSREQERYFVPYVIYEYFCSKDHFSLTENDYLQELERLGAQQGLTLEQAKKRSDLSFFLEKEYQEHTYMMLSREAEAYLEV